MSKTVISVKNVTKNFKLPHEKHSSLKSLFLNLFSLGNRSYENQHALRGISIDVKEGEFLGIVGRNGSGKSTLLKILAGIYQPTDGSVEVNGRLVPFIELGVGFNGELTGRENVFLNGALLGFSEQEIAARYEEIMSFAELEKFMDQKLKNYSSGMQVRLAFSVATILASTDILLIDEVLAVGDASFQRKCFEYFTELKANKKTVVFVSHDMEAIKEYCDRAILVFEGKIKTEGKPQNVAKEYFKLFNKETKAESADNLRWGTGRASIKNVSANATSENLTIEAHIIANEDIQDPVVGFNIRQANNDFRIFGTNTKIEGIKLGKIKKDSTAKIVFEIPNVFSESKYRTDIAVLDRNAIDTYDWWESALSFTIQRDVKLPFPLQIPVKVRHDIIEGKSSD